MTTHLGQNRLGLLCERLEARKIGAGPRRLPVLHAKIADIQPSHAAVLHNVSQYVAHSIPMFVVLVQLQRNLGHLNGLDAQALGQR
eukprot:CAMPEP_0205931512 /NCGR_PEP_ID=MMETSP1325-20131115/27506_1 /ASSEMBLY_ACC=CAM_ASM_000708 /TAXON_ID=236786 /ORGANISM="Florenciella sp., Strain RCC1007" /LENGTH=85 /DNA_ID=CAMNT_0053301091 /DNA_START=13 /DNA_END=266 /DNA_ORIENTATION=+